MAAYLNGELSPRARRRIARYIEADAACYNEYIRQRDLARELSCEVPLVGQPTAPQLDRIWAAVQAELTPANPHPFRRSSRMGRSTGSARYGLVGMAVALVLALPFTLGNGTVAFAIAPQPAPQINPLNAASEAVDVTNDAREVVARRIFLNTVDDATPQAQTAALVVRATPVATQN